MDAIKQQISELKTIWAEVYSAMRVNPSAWQPHLPNVFVEQIDEVIGTIDTWIEKIAVPEGFKPSFHLATGVVATSLPQLLVTAKNLQKGEYNYLQSFIGGLNHILSALHSMVVFSSKSEGKNLSADLAAQLAEALSLLGTAQRELAAKSRALQSALDASKETEIRAISVRELENRVTSLVDNSARAFEQLASDTQNQSTKLLSEVQAKVTEAVANIEARLTRISTAAENTEAASQQKFENLAATLENQSTKNLAALDAKITEFSATANTKFAQTIGTLEAGVGSTLGDLKERTAQMVKAIEDFRKMAQEMTAKITIDADQNAQLKSQTESLQKDSTELAANLAQQAKRLKELQDASSAQQLLIKQLLPDAASAGLAAGFEGRAKELEGTKKLWIGLFFFSILGLISVTSYVAYEMSDRKNVEVWLLMLERLPFIAPLVWLGWFSAIQYGNTIRVQEDYAFKAATSKAFAGFRDHMEHLANVNLGEGNNAMKFLAAQTIETLSHEPLRIFQKSAKDASPASSLLAMFERSHKKDGDK